MEIDGCVQAFSTTQKIFEATRNHKKYVDKAFLVKINFWPSGSMSPVLRPIITKQKNLVVKYRVPLFRNNEKNRTNSKGLILTNTDKDKD